jgi:hypothetical protein
MSTFQAAYSSYAPLMLPFGARLWYWPLQNKTTRNRHLLSLWASSTPIIIFHGSIHSVLSSKTILTRGAIVLETSWTRSRIATRPTTMSGICTSFLRETCMQVSNNLWYKAWFLSHDNLDWLSDFIIIDARRDVPIRVQAQYTVWNIFSYSNIGIVGSNPTRAMDVCVRLFCLC